MSRRDERQAQVAGRIVLAQLILTLAFAAGALAFAQTTALSILIGGGACTLATSLFAASVFGPYEARRPQALVGRIIGAEIGKLILVIGIFVFAFARVDDLNVPAMLAAYFAVQVLPAIIAPYWGAGSKP